MIEEDLAQFLTHRGIEGVITEVVVVTGFLAEDGEHHWSVVTRGDANVSTLVGLLEMAKTELISGMWEDDDA